nr:DUF2252 family protein [Streptomyces sp. AS13]
MQSSTPPVSASRHFDGSSRSSPRSRAKWLRVPAETTMNGRSRSSGDVFDRALATFAELYADQNEKDHQALVDAVRAGRVPAEAV